MILCVGQEHRIWLWPAVDLWATIMWIVPLFFLRDFHCKGHVHQSAGVETWWSAQPYVREYGWKMWWIERRRILSARNRAYKSSGCAVFNRQCDLQCAQMVAVVMLSSILIRYIFLSRWPRKSKQQCSIHRFCPDLSSRLWKYGSSHVADSALSPAHSKIRFSPEFSWLFFHVSKMGFKYRVANIGKYWRRSWCKVWFRAVVVNTTFCWIVGENLYIRDNVR